MTGEDEEVVDEEDSLPAAGEVSLLEVEEGEAVAVEDQEVVEHQEVVVVRVEVWELERKLLWSLTGTRVCLSPGERRMLCCQRTW